MQLQYATAKILITSKTTSTVLAAELNSSIQTDTILTYHTKSSYHICIIPYKC